MDPKMILLIIIGIVLLIALILLLAGGVGMGGMMMAGMMSTPFGWVALLIILALAGFLGWAFLYAH